MLIRTRLTARDRFKSMIAVGVVLLLCSLVFVWLGRLHPPARAHLKSVTGTIIVVSHRETDQGGTYLDIDLSTPHGTAHLSQLDYSEYYPAADTLQAGDTISALYEPDDMGRSIDWFWEIRKGNEVVVSYDETVAGDDRGNRLLREAGHWMMLFGAVLSAVGLIGQKRAALREGEKAARSGDPPSSSGDGPPIPADPAGAGQGAILPPPPRRVRLKPLGARWYLALVLLLLPNLGLTAQMAWVVMIQRLGHRVQANVVDVTVHRARDGEAVFLAHLAVVGTNPRRIVPVYTDVKIYWRFAAPPRGAGEHGKVILRELALGPLHGRAIQGHLSLRQSTVMRTWSLVVFSFLALGVLVSFLMLGRRRFRALCELGVVTNGVVTAQEPSRQTPRGKDIRYDYVDLHGARLHGHATARKGLPGEAMIPGGIVTVLYDRQKPKRSMVYELNPFEVIEGT